MPQSLTDAWLLCMLNERTLYFHDALIPKILLSFFSCHLCTVLFSPTNGYQAKEGFGEDSAGYLHSENCNQNTQTLSKHLEPGVTQTVVSTC